MKHLYIIAAMTTASLLTAEAQELNSEFTVTHQVVPEEQAATRLQLLPSIALRPVDAGRLPASTLLGRTALMPVTAGLEPAPWQTSLARWPWRGYAQLAYGPAYNLDASAGYRVADSETFSLDAFMQFNGFKYSSKHPDRSYRVYGPQRLWRDSFTAGFRSAWTPMSNASLKLGGHYNFSAHNIPMPVVDLSLPVPGPFADPELCTINHNFVNHNGVALSTEWRHAVSGKFSYTAGASYGLTAFSRYPDAPHENRGSISAGLRYDHGRRSHWTMDVSALWISVDGFGHKGVLSFVPRYQLTLSHFSASIGFKADFRMGNVKNMSIRPDITNNYVTTVGWLYPQIDLRWRPSAKFTLWGRTDGRTDANSLAALFEAQPYNYPANYSPVTYWNDDAPQTIREPLAYSRIYNFETGMTIGPWCGASITAFAGFHMASDWLMPGLRTGYWEEHDVAGGLYGIALDYSYRSYIAIKAKVELSSADDGDYDSGYYLWRDHARMDLTLSASSRPIRPLALNASFHLRTGRQKQLPGDASQNLGNIRDLDASAAYDITDRWTVSLRGENLLNHRYYLGPAIPSQGIRFMAGATYKF